MSDSDRTIIAPRSGLAIGTKLNGIYEIERLIGVGGMGEVYQGRAMQTGDAVAIKMVRPEMAQNQDVVALFRKEAAALHNLYHEAIVRYYVFAIDPVTQLPYLAMEFVDGQPLSERIKQSPLSLDEADVLRRRIATGLHAAHQLGIVHRDVSPDNIILPGGQVGRAKIIDFGIARSTQLGEATVIGSGFAGKYNYVSPEQLGLGDGDVTGRSDIYSLGLVLAEALAGRPLDMGGSQMQVLEKRRRLPDLSAVDARIRPLLARMLAPDPAQRPADMATVAAWQPPVVPAARPGGNRKPVAALAGIAAVLLVAGGGYALWSTMSPGRKAVSLDAEPPALMAPVDTPAKPLPAQPPVPPLSAPVAPTLDPVPSPPEPAPIPTPAPAPAPVPPRPLPVPTPVPAAPKAETLPPAPPIPAPPRSATERIQAYVVNYDGGACFFLWPTELSEKKADLEGFGSGAEPFVAFDTAFKAAQGFEATINLRPVTAAQCPMVDFLRQLGANLDRSPRLQIGAFTMKSGEVLSGTVEAGGGQNLDVILIGDDGLVYNLASYLKRDGAKVGFSLKLESTGGPARPQTVLALVSQAPLPVLSGPNPAPAPEFFANLARDVARAGGKLGLGVKYFRIQ